ncbi:hypothetical protein GCM10009641_23800 [Mycobacterium cookii]|uniref:Uncharacterized protein n=1 Tax=Mycobacterium cookii TaxID=1775 RepID=A0A7I7KU95_9MYCO|nr:hypothetical protein MCOO_10430 [Mycobacterium cookii]
MTATLPVAPVSVHSGAPPLAGAAVGQLLLVVAGSAGAGAAGSLKTGELDDDLADGGVLSELHAVSAIAAEAAQTASTMEEDTREEFTGVTLQPGDRSSKPAIRQLVNVETRLSAITLPNMKGRWLC